MIIKVIILIFISSISLNISFAFQEENIVAEIRAPLNEKNVCPDQHIIQICS